MKKLKFRAAFDFYQTHINRSDFFTLLKEHNLKTSGSVPSITWELFGSILTGKRVSLKGKMNSSPDLHK